MKSAFVACHIAVAFVAYRIRRFKASAGGVERAKQN
jgi:hypothetical protein